MAKKSKATAVVEEEVVLTPSLPMEDKVEPQTVKEDDVDVFIREQLKVINNMSNKAKARRLAARVLRNKRKG